MFTPSWGLYPRFNSKNLQYDDLQKLEEVEYLVPKKFTEKYLPDLACEITLEEASGIPLPRKEDYDWSKICNRELRMVLVDFKTQEFLSNIHILPCHWKQDTPTKWLFNAHETHQAVKQLMLRYSSQVQQVREVHLLFECVLFIQ